MKRKIVVLAATMLAGFAVVMPVVAQPSVDVLVDVNGASIERDCTSSSAQTWLVNLNVTVNNTSEDVVVFQQVGYFVKFNSPTGGPGQISNDVQVVDAGGFVAGETVPAHGSRTFYPVVRVTVPCDATGADVFATLKLVGRDKTYQDGAPFLDASTPVPLGPAGVLGIAVFVGAVGLLSQRLGRRPRSVLAGQR